MNLSLMLFPFHNELTARKLPPQKLIRDIWQAGITGLEPMLDWVMKNAACWGELRRAAADLEMSYPCLDVIVNLVGRNATDRRTALDVVARGVDCCAELKCPCALLADSNAAAGMSNEEGRKLYAEALAKAMEMSKGSGITLTIENFGMYPEFACSAGHVLEVLEASGNPNLKVTFDNGNFLMADERPTQCFGRLTSRIVHVHIKDFALCPPGEKATLRSLAGNGYKDCDIGTGKAEVEECLRLIKASRYAGWISLEVGASQPLAGALQGAQYVAGVWSRV